jgi:hypothetical protein
MAYDIYRKVTDGNGNVTYTRPRQTTMVNPLGGLPNVIISEDDVIVPNGLPAITKDGASAQINVSLTDPTVTFNVVDPTSGATIGTMNVATLHNAMYSFYLYLAAIRDATNP